MANAISSVNMSKRDDTTGKNWRTVSGVWKDGEKFIRRGKVGYWREEFEKYPQLLAEFDQWISDNFPKQQLDYHCDEI